jgi:hypothetical protein
MQPQPYDGDLEEYVALALKLCRATDAEALLVMLSGPTDWDRLKAQADSVKIVVAADSVEEAAGAIEAGLATIIVGMEDAPVIEKLTQALLNGVAREFPAADSWSSTAASKPIRSTRSASCGSMSTLAALPPVI